MIVYSVAYNYGRSMKRKYRFFAIKADAERYVDRPPAIWRNVEGPFEHKISSRHKLASILNDYQA